MSYGYLTQPQTQTQLLNGIHPIPSVSAVAQCTKSTLLQVDSRFSTFDSADQDYIIPLPETLSNITRLTIEQLGVFNTCYNISAQLGNNTCTYVFSLDTADVVAGIVITIPYGY